ncbi:hypothetical protein [Niveibacterium sp. SC-1]|uniref:hypothetical protein n=1 Tax=Niveibacterium sp. SC-1 TaxID=3135646 RepID=UPI00311E856B
MSAIAGQDHSAWRWIHLALHKPWFLATYVVPDGEAELGQTVMLSDPDQIAELVLQAGAENTTASLVRPDAEQLLPWTMAPLRRIWRAIDADRIQRFVYELRDGEKVTDLPWITESDLTEWALVVELPARERADKQEA